MYKPAIRKQDDEYYTLLVRVDADGTETVAHGYKGRFFKTVKAAERSVNNHIKKYLS